MKKTLIAFVALFFFFLVDTNAQYKVYGKVLNKDKKDHHGTVLTYEPEKTVTLLCQGDTLTFDLTKKVDFRWTTLKPAKKYYFPTERKYHRISAGILSGKADLNNEGVGGFISYSYHYQKTRSFGYGAGISFENYSDENGYNFIVPSLHYYNYLRSKNSTPFIHLQAGYGVALLDEDKFQSKASGGINVGAAVGVRLSTNKVMIDVSLGTKFQKADYNFDFIDHTSIRDIWFKRVEFSVGFMW
ncbi:MAG: hypothetical protein V3V14_10970 [Saprospiraceae bacterium]